MKKIKKQEIIPLLLAVVFIRFGIVFSIRNIYH